MSERDWSAGNKMAWEQMFAEAASHLGICVGEDGKQKPASYMIERVATVRALRTLCEEFGDNDWDDDLHLEDVIQKHLAPYITKKRR